MFFIVLLLMASIFLVPLYIFNSIMRNYLKIEKPKLFSYNYVNEEHKKIDWVIRAITIITLIVVFIYRSIYSNAHRNSDSLVLIIVLIVSFIATELTRAFMEQKYVENKKAYIFTISQLVFVLALLGIIVYTDFFNLFEILNIN